MGGGGGALDAPLAVAPHAARALPCSVPPPRRCAPDGNYPRFLCSLKAVGDAADPPLYPGDAAGFVSGTVVAAGAAPAREVAGRRR